MQVTRAAARAASVLALLVAPSLATASHGDAADSFARTKNLHPLGFSFQSNTASPFTANSDLAFWGKRAYQGHYDGFRIIDISAPGNPKVLGFQECFGNQGDIVVYGSILVRSWNSPAPSGATCDGEPVPAGFEGVHVFDISDISDPDLLAAVETECGSHTATGVPDVANDRLIVYSNVSSGCNWIDIIEVPLSDPAGASLLRSEPLTTGNNGCHDVTVILGDVNLAACASGFAANVFDIGDNAHPGGSLEDPRLLFSISEPGVGDGSQGSGRWHSAAFSNDGGVIVLGWEPGGGAAPRCTATGTALPGGVTQTDTHKSLFFYDASSGAKLGQWVLPREQTLQENCTIHNFNVVPQGDRDILVGGNYQAGIMVVDFTDPAAAREIAYADPAPVRPTQLAGDWSTYYYNGVIYESDITRGLITWKLSDSAVAGDHKLPYLNPQTQERVPG